ncbi:MAG: 4-alpha-glucanotransferase, partial [Anaerolineae bacterium]
GFEAYWEIPGDEETAVNGKWVPGPGADFLSALRDALGELPIIAEDLGVITPGVEKLRDDFELPGMKVLQIAWSAPKNPFLPHNHVENAVVYSGTHDNNTTVGWWLDEVDHGTRSFMQTYLEREIDEINWRFIQIGMASVGHTFIMTLQDVLGLGSKHRMNTPGKPGGNWQWRFTSQMLEEAHGDRLKHLTWLYQRRSDQQEQAVGDAAERETETS